VSLTASGAIGSVILIGNNSTLSFEDIEANFGELILLPPKTSFVFIFCVMECVISAFDEFWELGFA